MPTINEVLERVAVVRPDAMDDATKASWIMELDGKFFEEVILRHKVTPGSTYKGALEVCPVCAVVGVETVPVYHQEMDYNECPECGWTELPQPPREFPADGDKPLLAKSPYDNVYMLYVMAQVDFYNREMELYNSSAAMANQATTDYRKSYHRDHLPLPNGIFDVGLGPPRKTDWNPLGGWE